MWKLNSDKKFISGPLRELLKESAFLMMRDLGLDEDPESAADLVGDESFLCNYNEMFAAMTSHEQLFAVHFVLDHMLDEKKEAPAIRLWMDAAVDMLFKRLGRRVRRACRSSRYDIRRLVIEAYRDQYPRQEMMESMLELSEEWGEDDELPYAADAHRSRDPEFWADIIDQLSDVVLQDCDFEMVSLHDEVGGEGVSNERDSLQRLMYGKPGAPPKGQASKSARKRLVGLAREILAP